MGTLELIVLIASTLILIELITPFILHFAKLIHFNYSKQMQEHRKLMGQILSTTEQYMKLKSPKLSNPINEDKDRDNIGYI